MQNTDGWELFAIKKSFDKNTVRGVCADDAIPGTMDEDAGGFYKYVYRCSNCKKDSAATTPYCPYCGKQMMFTEKIIKEDAKKISVQEFNTDYFWRINNASSFIHCIDHALEKSDENAKMQMRVIGWDDKTKQTLNDAVAALDKQWRSMIRLGY